MRNRIVLKPQDIYVLLKLVVIGERSWSYADLAVDLGISPSQLHASVKRALEAQLAVKQGDRIVPHFRNLEEFLVHGVKHVFWAKQGNMTRGVPTSSSAPPLNNIFSALSAEEPPPVWPDPEGEVRGMAFTPLYKHAPAASRRDQKFYELLTLVDAIRAGRAREREAAIKELRNRITNPNIELLELGVHQLEDLVERLVFLGGCATGLLLTDPAAPPIRVTQDVDVITEVATRAEYYQLADILRAKGFHEDSSEDAPVCRWRSDSVILDVMPTDHKIFGFGSTWYQEALDNSTIQGLPSGKQIRMITAPYFLACKFAAFDGRGNRDFMMSHDMEDIVAVVDGRPELVEEIRNATDGLKTHLAERFQTLIDNRRFREALPGNMPPDETSQARVSMILARMKEIAALG